jgi:hypothetical protein
MNKIVEGINFASDAYWGDPERFNFRAMIDTYTTTTELAQGQDRTVKTTFQINMMGHIVPDSINSSIAGMNKFYSKSTIKFGIETAGTQEILTSRAGTPEKTAPKTRFYDSISGKVVISAISVEIKDYLALLALLETEVNSTIIEPSTNTIIFEQATIAPTPDGLPALEIKDFQVFINGVKIEPSAIDSIQNQDQDIAVQFNSNLGYTITDQMNIVLVGKILTT